MDTYRCWQEANADEPRGLAPAPVVEADWDGVKAWARIPLLYPIEPWVEEAWQSWWLPKQQALRAEERSDGNE